MIFFSFFKTLVGKEVAVEMKNGIVLTGTLVSVDQYLNVKLSSVNVVDTDRYPQLVRCSALILISLLLEVSNFIQSTPQINRLQASMKNCFVRGSVVR